jgi:hypothetical protein
MIDETAFCDRPSLMFKCLKLMLWAEVYANRLVHKTVQTINLNHPGMDLFFNVDAMPLWLNKILIN